MVQKIRIPAQGGLFWPIDFMPKIHPDAAAAFLLSAVYYAYICLAAAE